MATQLLPGDAQRGVQDLLARTLSGVNVGSVGELEIDDNGSIIFDPPCARARYVGGKYQGGDDNLGEVYDDTHHFIDVWCAAENLSSNQAQREDTLALVARVLPVLAGARIVLSDGRSEPARLLGISSLQDDPAGTVYIVSIDVPGIAQFAGSEA